MLDANKLQQAVDQAYTQFHSLNGGQNADYIPFLANVPGQLAAVAIVTCDGKVYSAGDSDYRFALESISKVCTLALALEDVGPQAVQDKIGADPLIVRCRHVSKMTPAQPDFVKNDFHPRMTR
mgnify:CR=1 FL=1